MTLAGSQAPRAESGAGAGRDADRSPERLTWEFLLWIWTYPKRRRVAILQRLAELKDRKQVVILQSSTEIDQFLNSWPPGNDSARRFADG